MARRHAVAATLAAATFLVVSGCLQRSDGGSDAGDQAGDLAAGPVLRFVALGDMGTGEADQARVASAIGTVCAARGCDFAIGLGDLIYPAGASSPTDPQFDAKFEEPYAALDFPFWMVLGNHDNGQDPAGATAPGGGLGLWYSAGNNEVAYAQRTDRASQKWTMPARHYTFDQGPVHFVGLDTNTLLFYGVPVPPDLAAALREQEDWLPGAVAAGAGPWRIAMGHHPYISNSEHGNAGEFDERPIPGQDGDHLKALFEEQLCDRIDLYLAGHDHVLQWLEPVAACGRTQFIVSGGGGAALYQLPGDGPVFYEQSTLGFWWIEVQGDTLHAVAFDDAAGPLFEKSIAKPIRTAL
ncbi:MAG TPA: metallophosphoesterase [Candidatus Thermoplasmatota archaeon]|nr:metallophosphoesterase [Candidatus Thermoplasmatota archaeon]